MPDRQMAHGASAERDSSQAGPQNHDLQWNHNLQWNHDLQWNHNLVAER
jgi:hypothetical protein